jgi:hypothetical protein
MRIEAYYARHSNYHTQTQRFIASYEFGVSNLLPISAISDFLIRQENAMAQISAYSGVVGAPEGANRGCHRSYKCHWHS